MLTINDLNPGTAIILNNQPHIVVWREHAMMGRGGGFVRTRLKNLLSGATIEQTFKGNDKLQEADLKRTTAQFLYFEDKSPTFMDMQTFDQFTIDREQIGDASQFLKEEMTVDILWYGDQPITATLPTKVDLTVTYTEPGFKGNTATNALKPATLETGAQVQVPMFINQGDVVRIDTRNGQYLERAK